MKYIHITHVCGVWLAALSLIVIATNLTLWSIEIHSMLGQLTTISDPSPSCDWTFWDNPYWCGILNE